MCPPKLMILFVSLLWLHAQAAAKEVKDTSRNFIGVEEIFSHAKKYHEKQVCVIGRYHDRGSSVIHNISYHDDDEYYEKAILLDSDDQSIIEKLFLFDLNSTLKLCGVLEVDFECWEAWEISLENKMEDVCVPFQRPIFLHITEIVTEP